jgi:hypothetical protein
LRGELVRIELFSGQPCQPRKKTRLLRSWHSDKRHVVFDSGHVPPPDMVIKEVLDWLDRYLGPVR